MTSKQAYLLSNIAILIIPGALSLGSIASIRFEGPAVTFMGLSALDLVMVVIGFICLLMQFHWCYIGAHVLGPDEIGLVTQFGRPLFQVSSGLTFAFPPVWKLIKETRLVIEEQFPNPQDNTSASASNIAVTHGESQQGKSDPLATRITTDVCIVLRYKIVDLKAFVVTVGNRQQLRQQVGDIIITTTQAECIKGSVSQNLSRLPEINAALKAAATNQTVGWGIDVVAVLLHTIDLGGAINDTLKNLPIAVINKEINRHNAQRIVYDGLAHADVHRAFAFAKAEGYKIIARELDISEPEALYRIDALTNIWRKNNADINLVGGDMAEVFKMITAFKSIGEGPSGKSV